MKIFDKIFSRNEYIKNQIDRSNDKFEYCKVSYKHVLEWQKILEKLRVVNIKDICCLGSRNGREIDLFRIIFNKYPITKLINLTEIRRNGWNNIFEFLLAYKRSDINNPINQTNVNGVEINPLAKRKDTFIGSFDEIPTSWENKYDLIYSNSFDQSMDPRKTALEWKRILKKNAIIIFSFSYRKDPTESDPVGGLNHEDVLELFDGELLYYNKFGSNYSDLILRINK
tara:strand:- start:4507 stop:5187 length:681 start_codon:yes stop_codon:yes gene_type:complete